MPTHSDANPHATDTRVGTHRTLAQQVALAVGAVFLLVGILGFVPGITTDHGNLGVAGHGSGAMLLGVFQVSVLHNVVHLVFGVAGILMSGKASTARTYLLAGGAVYLVLWVYGLVVPDGSSANVVPVNDADDWLHLVLGLGMVAAGVLTTRGRAVRHG